MSSTAATTARTKPMTLSSKMPPVPNSWAISPPDEESDHAAERTRRP
jgi:hypothetical protein